MYRSSATQTLLLILACVLPITSSQPAQGTIHVSLIHRDSSLSPLYNPQESPYDRVKYSFVRSKARLAYLMNKENDANDFQGEIEANDGEYFVKFSAGTPPTEMLAVMDTASELVMARCLPCNECNNNNQITRTFDASKSSTYTKISCNSSDCSLLPTYVCDATSMCSFVYGYADFLNSNSYLGRDVFTFETRDGAISTLEAVLFGCKYDHEGSYPRYNGILGLGLHNLSLITQMSKIAAPKFTYCIGNHSDPEAENRLILGNGMFLEGQTTTLKVSNGRYNLVVEGVSIGKRRLPISPEVFQLNKSGSGVIIDTGTMLTFLEPDAYYMLLEELEQELSLNIKMWPDPPYERCYNGKLSDIRDFQGVIFHFERDVNVLLEVNNLFLQVEDGMFCFGILPSPVRGVSVLGALFQQSYSVGYNLGDMLLSFQKIQCEVVEKHLKL